MAGRYFPYAEGEQVVWFNNFIAKLAIHSATVGLVGADVTAATTDANAYIYLVNTSATFKTRTQEVNDYKRTLLYGRGLIGAIPGGITLPAPPPAVAANVLARLSALVNRIKAAPGYSKAIGEDLGIEAPTAPKPDLDTAAPDFKLVALPGSVVKVEWTKARFSGVRIESRRGLSEEFEFLAVDTVSPYMDTRPPLADTAPETRQYRLRYLNGDKAVGQNSVTKGISTIP